MVKIIEYHFVSSHELFECTIKNNVEVWIRNKGTQTLCNFFFNFAFSSPNQKDCFIVDAKCLVFLQISQETPVCISRVLETQYQPFTGPCSRRAFCQVLISSSYPHYFPFGFFWS